MRELMEFFQTLHLDSFIDDMLWNIVTLFRNRIVFLTSLRNMHPQLSSHKLHSQFRGTKR